ncbi:hypothetical protein DPMN_166920 [Dreissena polymorpha]|uniref:Uncharacterized protein n=1 Tax=Dreissena polymorpha TaxID=45954 RepID=A0A9D4EYW2_DREPO|nr:hypothetical protein DPMN_166920 [Dreissena polymorpha]
MLHHCFEAVAILLPVVRRGQRNLTLLEGPPQNQHKNFCEKRLREVQKKQDNRKRTRKSS